MSNSNKCRLCGNNSNSELLNFGLQPIIHHLIKDIDESYKTYPFILGVCDNCNFLSLMNPLPANLLYNKNYFTVSDWKFQPHSIRLIDLMQQISGMNKDTKLLEIGCNDGKFLKELIDNGINDVRGIEPTDRQDICLSKNLNVEKGFFPSTSLKEKEFDLIVTRQVLEHIIDLDLFISSAHIALKDEGTIVIEVPDITQNLECLDFGLWEEHVNYFSTNTLQKLLAKHQFEIIHYERTMFSGATLTVFAQKTSNKLNIPISYDEKNKINKFKKKYDVLKTLLHDHLNGIDDIIVYGCGARSSAFVNFFDLNMINCFVDDKKEKQNLIVPGCNLPIKPWSNDFKESFCLLGVNSENEEKLLNKRFFKRNKSFSILPPSRRIPSFWRNLINN